MKRKEPSHLIVGIHVTNRVRYAGVVQKVLTDYGAHIQTRLGLHDVEGRHSSPGGLILLEMVGDEKPCAAILSRLNAIRGVDAQHMVFAH